jgi:hypothetical protein
MIPLIINVHVIDPHNIGDTLSAPVNYFDFPGFEVLKADIRHLEKFVQAHFEELQNRDRIYIIVGGGGLLFTRFFRAFQQLKSLFPQAFLIAWGIGQQIYEQTMDREKILQDFPYADYLERFNIIGIRDYGLAHEAHSPRIEWVPCASCLHPLFDVPREIKHPYVVFSHQKFQLNFPAFPRMTHDCQDFKAVLDFLGSGEIILTSSYHGAYWGTLLGRKVLAFPFSTKFQTLKHSPAVYPVAKWTPSNFQIHLFGKTLYQRLNLKKFTCSLEDWQSFVPQCQTYPQALGECRERNQQFFQQLLQSLG